MHGKKIEDFKNVQIKSVVTRDNKLFDLDTKGLKSKPQIIDTLLIGWTLTENTDGDYFPNEVKIPTSEIISISYERNNYLEAV